MGFQTEFNSVCKFKSAQELYELLEYGRGKMVKSGFRVFPTGQKVIAYTPENQAIAIVGSLPPSRKSISKEKKLRKWRWSSFAV